MIKRATLLLALCVAPLPAAADSFSFALIGDFPYTDIERRQLPGMLDEIGRDDLAFVVHDGDIKDGHSRCSDEIFVDRLRLFQASRHPFVYVPGDNEWTDCSRRSNGGYDPLERLQKLRQLFFPDDLTLGQRKFRIERQSSGARFPEFRENVRWTRGRVLFVGLNVPGGNNNIGSGNRPPAEYPKRARANRAWLAQAFAKARAEKLAGVLIVIQANPEFEAANAGHPPSGYREFLEQLRGETLAFPGAVVLVHGDTHTFRIDKPLLDPKTRQPLANFTRVETFGSPLMGWVRATADDADPSVFRFEAHPYAPRNGAQD